MILCQYFPIHILPKSVAAYIYYYAASIEHYYVLFDACVLVCLLCAFVQLCVGLREKRGLSDFIWIKSSLYIRLLIVFKHTSRWTVFLLLYSGGSFNLVFSSCCSFAPHGSVRRVCLFLCHCLGRTQHVNFNKGLHERAKH